MDLRKKRKNKKFPNEKKRQIHILWHQKTIEASCRSEAEYGMIKI